MRVLIVTYGFPPVGGAGVQRMLKLAKYLPHHGVVPSVLTVSNPSVPVIDESLARDLPANIDIIRARTFEPGYRVKQAAWEAKADFKPTLAKRVMQRATGVAKQLLIPDPQVLWQPAAQLALARRLAAGKDDAVIISGPPFSQFMLAPLARARPGVGVVLDYRDEWSTYRTMYEMMGSRLVALLGDTLEAALLRSAHIVTTATEEFRENLLEQFSFLDPARVVFVPNGYDPEDFPSDLPEPPSDRFVITYAGTVFKLTSAAGFLGGLRRLHAAEPELADLLDVRFIGRIVDTELASFEGAEDLGVKQLGYHPHATVIRELSASHLALCILDDVPNVERIYPAKIFELMFLGRPILTLAPDGALTRLVHRHQLGEVVAPRDEAAIAATLDRLLRAFTASSVAARTNPRATGRDIGRFDRRATAKQFAEVAAEASRLAR
jgi:glycosyltransferase involved in cell wall biosynthesis